MRYSFRHLILLVAPLALLIGLSVFNLAQQQDDADPALNFSNLTFEIATTNKKEFVKLEPIPITLTQEPCVRGSSGWSCYLELM